MTQDLTTTSPTLDHPAPRTPHRQTAKLLSEWHDRRLSVLAGCPGTDVLACETLPSLMEMEALVSSVGPMLQHILTRIMHFLCISCPEACLPLSVVRCLLSVVHFRCPSSVVRHPLSVLRSPFSVLRCPLSVVLRPPPPPTRPPYLSGAEPPEAPSRCTQGLA